MACTAAPSNKNDAYFLGQSVFGYISDVCFAVLWSCDFTQVTELNLELNRQQFLTVAVLFRSSIYKALNWLNAGGRRKLSLFSLFSFFFFLFSIWSFKHERDSSKVDCTRSPELLPVHYTKRHMELWSVAMGDLLLRKYTISWSFKQSKDKKH